MSDSIDCTGLRRKCGECGNPCGATDSFVHIEEPVVVLDARPDGGDLVIPDKIERVVVKKAVCIDIDEDYEAMRSSERNLRSMKDWREQNKENDNRGWWFDLNPDGTISDPGTWHGTSYRVICEACH
jgi:hypothetical protein